MPTFKIISPIKSLLSCIVLTIFTAFSMAADIFVAPNGSDANMGTIDSPFGTLQKALDHRALVNEGNIFMRGGWYFIESPVLVMPHHTPVSGNLEISAYNNERVTISGGRKLSGWEKNKNGLWETTVPDVKNGNWKFKEFYVNGELRLRARKPNYGFLRIKEMPDGTPKTTGYQKKSKSFVFGEGDFDANWKNLENVEVIVYHFWTDSHLKVESIDKKTNTVTFRHPAGKVFTDDFTEIGARYIIENVFEELDQPGEWYLDLITGKCYYLPFPDEDIDSVEIIAPFSEKLVQFGGDPMKQELVKNISFNNIAFCHTNFELPDGNTNNQQGSASVSAAFSLKGAQNCSFSRCSFFNLGGWAFELQEGCRYNIITQNEISTIAAGGFRINGGTYRHHPFLMTGFNQITFNHIHHYGEVYPSAVGILLQHTEGNLVANNHIHDGYYTGISIGWEWGYQRSISRDNVIENNHIHHIGKGLLSDMGAIYTLGVSPGTIVRNNLIHDVDANRYGGWGIYLDEGSTHILVENNIVYNTKFAPFNIHFAKESTVRNNIFALGKLQQIARSRVEPHKSVYFEQNIIYWKEGKLLDGEWRDKPYTFYFHPKDASGTREITETFDMDYNLYFNPDKNIGEVDFNGLTWDEWNKAGKDVHSIYADPLFEDAENFDFRLRKGSPAFKLGFKPINMNIIGNGK